MKDEIRIWLVVPVSGNQYECTIPVNVTLRECIPYLNALLEPEHSGIFTMDSDTVFAEPETNTLLSLTVTIMNLHLSDGMRLWVY
ncbi:MAG: hypothetical protein J6S26_04020 [Solobacterium sp.]|nr:hypothetical protein [Solobacterium sp.]